MDWGLAKSLGRDGIHYIRLKIGGQRAQVRSATTAATNHLAPPTAPVPPS